MKKRLLPFLIMESCILGFFIFVTFAPYSPGQFKPIPLRVTIFNIYAKIGYVLSLGILKFYIICSNALENDLSSYMWYSSLYLLPFYIIAGIILVSIGRFFYSIDLHKWISVSLISLAILIISWLVVFGFGIKPSEQWDIALLCLGWISVIVIPISLTILIFEAIKNKKRS